MNIGNVTQSHNTLVVDGNSISAAAEKSGALELKNGSTIQGTVISVTDTEGGKMANIEVGDNVISAKLQDGMGLREGQSLNFAVKTGSGSTPTLTPLYENTSLDQNTLKALTAAGIEVNNDTINMVKDMMEAGLPIGKDALLDMNRSINAFPNASISSMVEMKSLNIPITENNIQQFESYKNYEHQVTNAMENIMDELPDAFNSLIDSGNDKGALDLYGSVLELFGGEETIGNGAGVAISGREGAVESQAANADPSGVLGAAENAAENSGEVKDTAYKEITDSLAGGSAATEGTAKEAAAGEIAGERPGEGVTDAANANNAENVRNAGNQPGNISGNILSDDFLQALKNLGISDKLIDNYEAALKGQMGAGEGSGGSPALESAQKELLKELADSFSQADLSSATDSASWKKLFSSDDYNKLLKDNISNQWLLKPSDVEKKENVDNLYQRLQNQVKDLTNAITQNLGADSKLTQTANSLQNNLDFMNQLNQMFQYVQLPLQMAGQNAHGDLYVYTNKNKKVSEDGSVSAILHLDMENLGPVDVYVKMKDTKVTTNFYVADGEVIDLINDNIHILNERLKKRGYTMSVNLALHDDKDAGDAAVDAMLDVSKTPIMSVNSFDARA